MFNNAFNVKGWDETANTVTSKNQPSSGATAVADPRVQASPKFDSVQLGVRTWNETFGVVTGQTAPGGGRNSVADPRFPGGERRSTFGVKAWDQPSGVVAGETWPTNGAFSVSDPRVEGRTPFNNVFRIVKWDSASPAVSGAGGAMANVADPRPPARDDYKATKYRVTAFKETAGTVISASGTGNGAFAVADPRPACLTREGRDGYKTQGHYGVSRWEQPSGAVPAFAKNNNGRWSVADPRVDDVLAMPLPASTDQLVCVIRALDNTWHRPLTTLELAALQSLVDPEEHLELEGLSDSAWRERIGNAVPPKSATAIAGVMGRALLASMMGETFSLSSEPIWVRPIAVALALDGGAA